MFDDEIVPVELKSKKGTAEFTRDEHVRPDASMEGLGKLKPVFKPDGTVTAGNASGMNDAGAAVVLMSAAEGGGARRAGARPDPVLLLLRRRPEDHGHRPGAGRAQGAGAGRPSLDDVDVIELNEAFAAQALAVMKDLDLDPREGEPERRRDRPRPPDRRDRRGDHDEDPLRDGARGPRPRAS